MSPECRLLLIEGEMERFLKDERVQPERDRVFVDRVSRILSLDLTPVS